MERIVYVNGDYIDETRARVSIFDRGFLFADAIYEVTAVIDGLLVDNTKHLARMHQSLAQLGIQAPVRDTEIIAIQQQLIAKNQLREGIVYLQITRGVADRNLAYPNKTRPGLILFTQALEVINNPLAQRGIRVISVPDIRWRCRDIKTVGILPAAMAKQAALSAGVDDAWMVENGYVTEGTSNNAAIITQDGVLVTRPLSSDILHGITRAAVLELSRRSHIAIEERPFTIKEACKAREAFSTSASTFILPVIEIDHTPIGTGKPGPITERLREHYIKLARATGS